MQLTFHLYQSLLKGNLQNNTPFLGITWWLIPGSTSAEWQCGGFRQWLPRLQCATKCHLGPFSTRHPTATAVSRVKGATLGRKLCSGEAQTHTRLWCASFLWRIFKGLVVPTNICCYLQDHLRQTFWCRKPAFSIPSVVPPLMRDLPKFGHVSADVVYRVDSDCTCGYCNHVFKQTFKPLKKYLYSQMWLMCLLNQVQAMTGMRTLRK